MKRFFILLNLFINLLGVEVFAGWANHFTTSETGFHFSKILFDKHNQISTSNSINPLLMSDNIFKFNSSDYSMQNPPFQFFQNDYNLNGYTLYDSDWGTLVITLPYFTGLLYVNLSINAPGITTQWQIQNGIIQNQVTPGNFQEHSFTFDIGDRGIDVANIFYGIEITPVPLYSAPEIIYSSPVSQRMVGLRDGVGAPVSYPIPEPPLAKPFECPIDPSLIDSAAHVDFPNQECPYRRFCTPTGISNSLKFLNKKHNLDMDTTKLSIDSIAKALGTDTASGSPEDWPTKKKNYMESRKLPITTRELPASDVKEIKKEILNGQDVEIDIDNDTTKHTACVTGIVELGNGKYEISTSDDTEQEAAGGLATNAKSIYDTTDKKFTGGELTDFKIIRFIVECPNKLKTTPGSPSNNSFSVPMNTSFTWDNVPGADSYWLEVSSDINFSTNIIDERNVSSNVFHQMPVVLLPGTAYFWRVRVNDSAGPGTYDTVFAFSTGNIATLNLTVLIQGFYNSASNTMTSDSGKIFLHDASSPYSIIDSSRALLNSTGSGLFAFYNTQNGVNYFLDFRHRNSIQTWSFIPVSFNAGFMFYNFSNAMFKAYGSNQIQVDSSPIRFAVYSADVNQDESVDAADMVLIYNDVINSAGGYISTDVNGDGLSDVQDLIIVYNNALNLVTTIRP